MPLTDDKQAGSKRHPHTWEEAISILRRDPAHRQLIHDAYLSEDLVDNCRRFRTSSEFAETLRLLRAERESFRDVLDMPGGNGIATIAFAAAGFDVTTVEPDPSDSVGRGAIKRTLEAESLHADLHDARGEALPFAANRFDVAYVRQGLHHARDLPAMVAELARVLRPGGVLLAAREHVVDDYGSSLQRFLDSQPDHQLYGGEHAFTLDDYRGAFAASGLQLVRELGPYDSPINMHPNTPSTLRRKILESVPGRLLSRVLPTSWVVKIGMRRLATARMPGRLYTFLLKKPVGHA